MLVIVVGKSSCAGKIMDKLVQKIEATPLQMKLEALANDIGRLGVICAMSAFHILLLRFFIERFVRRDLDLFGGEGGDYPNG